MILNNIDDIDLVSEITHTLILLTHLRQWGNDTQEMNDERALRLISLIETMNRPIVSITELCSTEREWLIDMLMDMDITVDEILRTIDLFNAISCFLAPNQMKTLLLKSHHTDFFHLRSLPF